ncbi:MAG: glycosyltransferase family 39 protein [bacterium]|nr:glycosyltransferase family 39 protein [bacterium]
MKQRSILISILLIYVLWFYISIKAVLHNSQTFDESVHITAGAFILKKGIYNFNIDAHPPLSEIFQALPLLFKNPTFPTEKVDKYSYADVFMYDNLLSHEFILNSARFMNIIVAFICSIFVFIFSFKLTKDIKSTIIATLLFLFNPNIIAHATVATTDMMLTLTSFTLFGFLCFIKDKTLSYAIAGLLLSFVLSSKYPAIIFFPLFFLFLFFKIKKLELFIFRSILVFAGLVFGFFIIYGSNIDLYFKGLLKVIKMQDDVALRPSILFDERSLKGFWYYFIVGFVLKNPLQFTIISFLSIFKLKKIHSIFILPAIIWFMLISYGNVHIGFRYALVIYPFLSIIFAVAFSSLRKNVIKYIYFLCCLLQVFESVVVSPHYISYFIPLIKDEKKFLYMTDSNLDWGQGLKELSRIVDKPSAIVYFGTARPQYYGLKVVPLIEDFSNLFVSRNTHENPVYFIISATQLAGTYIPNRDRYRFLRHKKPEYIICDGSIFVYRFKDVESELKKMKLWD